MTSLAPTLPRTDEAAAFLYREARLLDELRLDEWLELFAPDALYWVPIDTGTEAPAGAEAPPSGEPRNTSLFYDTDIRRRERVYRLLSTPLPSQNPPSRTMHIVSNVEVSPAPEQDRADLEIRSAQLVVELRTGDHSQRGLGEQRILAGHCTHRVQRDDDQWRIALKKLVLLSRDIAVPNLTFML